MVKNYKSLTLLITAMMVLSVFSTAQQYNLDNNWGVPGLTLKQDKGNQLLLNHSLSEFMMVDVEVKGNVLKSIKMPATFLPNNEGAPDLPGTSKQIAIPLGASASVEILSVQTEKYSDVDIAPAPRIPLDTESGPLHYKKNPEIYTKDKFYPENPVMLSDPYKIRGIDVVMVGVTPFQYNPVTKELIVYKDIEIEVNILGGSGKVGDERLRSRWWDPIIYDAVINPEAIPQIDYSKKAGPTDTPDYEYLIITPNDPTFIAWADSIKRWRTLQGIKTGVVTTTEVGGNTTSAIENYVNNAYNTWDVPPAAVMLLGDYGTSGNTIVSPVWDNYCVSDNIYADVDNDDLPDIIFARMTAQNATHLETMITKFLDHERTPPTNPGYYNNPITACGWQTERWFQLCSEIVGGYWKYVMGKNPVRINEIYSGTPGSSWSTNSNTSTIVNYFGPGGLGYIPSSPSTLGGWTGGNATMVNNAINSGAFMLQHRDHGGTTGWGEPAYYSSDINGLNNSDLTWVFSINCLTGKYNNSSECFAEKFHRYTYNGQNSGALGITAASEVSYSFVNDTYVWGLYDNMWPDFMPAYGTTPPSRDVLPAFGNAAGKIFLQASSWPYNPQHKEYTHHLFHHHGDAFSTVYSNMPQNLSVSHDAALLSGVTTFTVTANDGSFIALTVNEEIIGTAEGTGGPFAITIPSQDPGDVIVVTITKQDYYRYSANVDVIPPSGPYIAYDSHSINDASGNNNGQADFGEDIFLNMTLENAGSAAAYNVTATLVSTDPYVTIINNMAAFGTINAGNFGTVNDAFALTIADDIPDQHNVNFELQITGNADDTWMSNFSITVNAPVLGTGNLTIDDAAGGNGNGRLDPGETANIIIQTDNEGNSDSPDATGTLNCLSPYITINTGTYNFGSIVAGTAENAVFNITADAGTPAGTTVNLNYDVVAGNYSASDAYSETVGQIPVLIINFDPNNNSAPAMQTAMTNLSVSFDVATSIPADLNLYTSVFVCLGIYSSNHVLSSSEGTTLANYLNSGGQLYMEGGDTWYYDSQTSLQPMFNINPTADGSGDMSTVSGQSGTFTQGMTFSYSGENNWMDHIDPISPAFSILKNQSPVYGTGVAYDAGTYKTIGTSHEFGGLNDGTFPSTKEELMNQYLTFFGITGTPLLPPDISVNPLSFNVTLGPDEMQTETLSITNSGEVNLNFNIGISGSDALPGKMLQELTKETLENLRYKENFSNVTDELTGGPANSQNWALPPIQKYGLSDNKGEETFGSWSGGTWSGDSRDRGNVFHVTSSTTLEEIRFYMDISSSTSMYFFVYEGTSVTGNFTKVDEVYISNSGTGEGWYSSGPMTVSLEAGNYYYIGTSWYGTATYGRGTDAVPVTTSFGTLETGIPGTIAGYPPGSTLSNTYTDISPYYQTLVTSSIPTFEWLVPNPLSGSVSAFSSFDVDVLFDATGMTEGTYYKDLTVNSNDPDQPSVIIPCTLNVISGMSLEASIFLEGPFSGSTMTPYLNVLNMIPLSQPYNVAPWNYNGTESVPAIPNADIIDWVLVELRETSGGAESASPATMVGRQAALLLKDGSIVSTDGTSPLSFNYAPTQDIYVVVWHRNHLAVMASNPASLNGSVYEYDFTSGAGQVYGNELGHKQLEPGIWGMVSGDAECDMEINNLDKNDKWYNQYSGIGYFSGDLDMNGFVDNVDKNIPWKLNAGKCSMVVQ